MITIYERSNVTPVRLQFDVNMFPNLFLAIFMLHLPELQVYSCKANHTSDITLYRVITYFLCFSLHSAYAISKMFKIKLVDHNETCSLC
jgi:hypothetical protein